jgi:hypothetical protein
MAIPSYESWQQRSRLGLPSKRSKEPVDIDHAPGRQDRARTSRNRAEQYQLVLPHPNPLTPPPKATLVPNLKQPA